MNNKHPQSPEGTLYTTIGQSPIIRFTPGLKALKGRYISYGFLRYAVLSGLPLEAFTFMGLRPMLNMASLRDFGGLS